MKALTSAGSDQAPSRNTRSPPARSRWLAQLADLRIERLRALPLSAREDRRRAARRVGLGLATHIRSLLVHAEILARYVPSDDRTQAPDASRAAQLVAVLLRGSIRQTLFSLFLSPGRNPGLEVSVDPSLPHRVDVEMRSALARRMLACSGERARRISLRRDIGSPMRASPPGSYRLRSSQAT